MSHWALLMVKPGPGPGFPAQQGLLGLGRALQQFAPHWRSDRLVQAIVLRGGANAVEDDGDSLRIPDAVRIRFEASDLHHFALPRGHEPNQDKVDPVDSCSPCCKFARAHSAGRSPMVRAPAAPWR